VAVCLGVAVILFFRGTERNPPQILWTMINVNDLDGQGDANLLEFRGGKNFLIDAGQDGRVLVPFLAKKGVRHLDKVIISHAHKDHYGGIRALLASGMRIDEVVMALPPREECNAERPWGCDYEDVKSLFQVLRSAGVSVANPASGKELFEAHGRSLEILYAFDGEHSPFGHTDINGTSLVIRLTVGPTSVLFTGDLNGPIGTYLVGEQVNLHADILKVPHHGTEATVPTAFLDRVHPQVALVPSPKILWLSERSRRIREYLQDHRIKTYVNGIDGTVTVAIGEKGYSISTTAH